jgi:hypothetical protein
MRGRDVSVVGVPQAEDLRLILNVCTYFDGEQVRMSSV